MSYRHLLLCASLLLLAACSGSEEDNVTELQCDDSHGCPDGFSCIDNVCIGADASIGNDQVQASGEAAGASVMVEVETDDCKGPTCKIEAGSDVTFRAPMAEGYRFTGWSGDPRCTGSEPVLMLQNVAANIRCVANYVKRVVIEGLSAEAGASVGAASSAGFALCEGGRCEVDQGSSVTLTATAFAGHRFAGFAGAGCENVTGSVATVVAPAENVTCTASYVLVHTVTGNVDGGSAQVLASSSTPSASCTANSCNVDAGGSVTLTAPLSAGFRFTGWSGSEGCSGSEATITLSGVSAAVLCTAHYLPRFIVAGQVEGLGASDPKDVPVPDVSSADAFANCSDGTCEVDGGGAVTISAPIIGGYKFLGFGGDPECENASGLTLQLTNVQNDITCSLSYEALPPGSYNVAGSMSGAQGTITAAPAQSCNGSACVITEGNDVTFTAPNLAPTHRFLGWRGANAFYEPECVGVALALPIQNVSRDLSCVANYVPRFKVDGTSTAGGVVDATSADANSVCVASGNTDSCTVDAGKSVTLSAVPSSGYRFGGWTGGGACTGSTNPLALNNVASNVTCTANFVREFIVTYAAATGGTVSAPAATCPTGSPCTVDTGTSLDITAVPSSGYRFGSWSGSGCTDTVAGSPLVANLTVASNVSCTANFIKQVTVSFADPANGSVASSNVTPVANSTCTGTSCTFDSGGSIRLTATPDANYRFVAWTGCSSSTNAQLDLANVTSDASCVATFVPRVTVTFADPTGGSVAASNVTPLASATCNSTSCTIDQGGSLRLTASADSGYRFVSWSGCSNSTNTVLDLSNIAASTSCTALFMQRFTVTYSASAGGSVSAPSAQCPSNSPCTVDTGTALAITAQANTGYRFNGWTGSNCTDTAAGTPLVADLAVASNVTCTASFVQQITVTFPDPTNGSVASSNVTPSANSTCTSTSCTFDTNGSIRLTATADANYRFTAWSGCSTSTNATLDLANVVANATCTANFVRRWTIASGVPGSPSGVTITAAASGTAAQSTCTNPVPGAGNCVVDQGLTVTLTTNAVTNYNVTSWTGTNCASGALSNSNRTLTFTNVTASASCTPVYASTLITVTIAKTPSAIPDTIQISAPGCTANATSCTVAPGTTVTLTVNGTKSAEFLGWSGTQCTTTNGSYSFAASQTQTCTAKFSGYWAMLFSHTGTNEQYNAVVPFKDRVFAFGSHGTDARIGAIDAATGVMGSDETLYALPTATVDSTFTWYDASLYKDTFAAVGQYQEPASRIPVSYIFGDGGQDFMRQIQVHKSGAPEPSTFTEALWVGSRLYLTGKRASYATVLAVDFATLIDPLKEDALHLLIRPGDCKDGFYANVGGGLSPTKSGLVLVTTPVGLSDLWLVQLDSDLKYVGNRPLNFDAKVGNTSLTVEKVLPTPAAGGFLIVGSMFRQDLDGFVIKVGDDLVPEFAFYMQHAGEDAFVGADVLATGEYVLAGRTLYGTMLDGWFMKVSKDGKTISTNVAIGTTSGRIQFNESFTAIHAASDVGLNIVGTRTAGGETAAWALHANDDGSVEFNAASGGHIAPLSATDMLQVPFAVTLGQSPLCEEDSMADTIVHDVAVEATRTPPTEVRQAW